MDERVRLGFLYDFYGELLPEHGRDILENIIIDDLSLSEIAEAHGITRQAVHDVKRRYAAQLEEYEGKLHLLDKYLAAREKLQQMEALGSDSTKETFLAFATEIVENM